MKTILKDYYCKSLKLNNSLKKYDSMYNYYRKACDDLNLLINGNLDTDEYWDIIDKYYDIELFEDEHDTIMTCNKLGIKYKRLNTDFILYQKWIHAPKFYFEDWIIMETGKVDTRRIYSENEIDKLIESEDMVVLYPFSKRPESKRLSHEKNSKGSYDLKYNGEFVIDESELNDTYGEIEGITEYYNWEHLYFDAYNNPLIQERIRERIFTHEKVERDIDYYRFRALETLKLTKNTIMKNNVIQSKKLSLY